VLPPLYALLCRSPSGGGAGLQLFPLATKTKKREKNRRVMHHPALLLSQVRTPVRFKTTLLPVGPHSYWGPVTRRSRYAVVTPLAKMAYECNSSYCSDN